MCCAGWGLAFCPRYEKAKTPGLSFEHPGCQRLRYTDDIVEMRSRSPGLGHSGYIWGEGTQMLKMSALRLMPKWAQNEWPHLGPRSPNAQSGISQNRSMHLNKKNKVNVNINTYNYKCTCKSKCKHNHRHTPVGLNLKTNLNLGLNLNTNKDLDLDASVNININVHTTTRSVHITINTT